MTRKSLVICVLLSFASSLLAKERTYPIQLVRPDREGVSEAIECVVAYVSSGTTTWEGYDKPVTDEKVYAVRLVGVYQTLKVDEHQHELADLVVVRSCTKTTDDGESQVLPRGTRIVARAGGEDGETNFRIDGEIPSKDVATAVKSIIHITPPDEAGELDAISGSSTPRKPGESWAIDSARAARLLTSQGTHVQPSDVTGTTRFVGVETYNGVECLHVEVDSEVKHYYYPPPRHGRSNTATTAAATSKDSPYTGTLSAHSVFFLPVDPSISSPRRSSSVTFAFDDNGSIEGKEYHRENTVMHEAAIRVLGPATQP